jgi:hypothetical protein
LTEVVPVRVAIAEAGGHVGEKTLHNGIRIVGLFETNG